MSLKITELLKSNKEFSYSFEVTPEVREEELNNLKLTPAFFSITWHAQGHKCKNLDIAPLKLAKFLKSQGKEVLLHLSCNLMKTEYLDRLLTFLRNQDICNLFVILGDCFDSSSSDFKNSQELITYIRQSTGGYFCIGVAGFPGCDDKLMALKEKVDCGADFILTQAFFEYVKYKEYLDKCEQMGITVPIIPGIFPFEKESELNGFVNLCKVHVNEAYMNKFKSGTSIVIIQDLLDSIIATGTTKHFHLFTLNKFQRTSNLLQKYLPVFKQREAAK